VTRATAVVCLLASSCAVIAGLDDKRLTPEPASGGSASVGLGGVGGSAAETSGGEAGSGDAGATAAGTGAGLGGSGAAAGRGGSGATGGKGGGSGAGGQGGAGGVAGSMVGNGGNPPTAGIGGGGSTGTAGGSNAAGATGEPFPRYGVLDDFNRPGPEVGSNWIGAVGAYDVQDLRLDCVGDYCAGMFWHEQFGAVQEAFVTFAYFDPTTAEINLVVKAQGKHDCDLIELMYNPMLDRLLVEACWGELQYRNFGQINVELAPGDQLGARARADGFIEVFKNGSRIGLFDATSYPFIDQPGYIGVNGFTGSGKTSNGWDDFGGGGE
jgi:hypothetical protein